MFQYSDSMERKGSKQSCSTCFFVSLACQAIAAINMPRLSLQSMVNFQHYLHSRNPSLVNESFAIRF
jgi:hypothetical protein